MLSLAISFLGSLREPPGLRALLRSRSPAACTVLAICRLVPGFLWEFPLLLLLSVTHNHTILCVLNIKVSSWRSLNEVKKKPNRGE